MTVPPPRHRRRRRRAGRAIVLDPGDRVLMMRGEDPADRGRGGFWFTPGGGIQGNESIEAATRRELREELGLEIDELGPVVMVRVDVFAMGGVWYEQSEELRLARLDAPFEPVAPDAGGLELATITGFRWLSIDELTALDEPFYPRALPDLIEYCRAHGPPTEPWRDINDAV